MIASSLRALEARLDAWAAKRLTPEEYAEAMGLDRKLKQNRWRALWMFALVVLLVATVLMALRPQSGLGMVLFFAFASVLGLGFTVISAWYGYRKWSGKPAWWVFAVLIAVVMVGGAMGFVSATIGRGRSFADIGMDTYTRAAAVTFLVGFFFAALLVGISRMRLRDAAQTAARLTAEAERERVARQGMQAELKLLQAQVEPHFLFNTLSNVRYLVQTQSPDAIAMLDHLIRYLRNALPEIRSEGSTLGREGELARAYLEIMRLRMGGALEFTIDVPRELHAQPFPPLMLITLVENAIKHGVAPMGRGRVDVRAAEADGAIRIEVQDDGRGLVQPVGHGVGLVNVRERLRALHGDAARLTLESPGGNGTVAAIVIPR
ncbi:MAG TPA: histidine kinase [Usitatibacter sp.]|nr:histidine kinase [Usitatibacter sp.]